MGIFNKDKKEEQYEMVMVKKKKPFYKRIGFWVVIVLLIIGANACGKDTSSQPAKPTDSSSSQPAKSTAPEAEKPKYEILEDKVTKEEYGSRFVSGKIKNNAGRDVGYISIEINLYDKDGNQVGSTIDATNNLEKDGTWKFKAFISEENAVSYKIKDVSGF